MSGCSFMGRKFISLTLGPAAMMINVFSVPSSLIVSIFLLVIGRDWVVFWVITDLCLFWLFLVGGNMIGFGGCFIGWIGFNGCFIWCWVGCFMVMVGGLFGCFMVMVG